ncbi:hypothetical protein M0805_009030 [Coniferiporia weirii]|nr:hypothetical protein M0805_009030 [Coniferiporia weirii]
MSQRARRRHVEEEQEEQDDDEDEEEEEEGEPGDKDGDGDVVDDLKRKAHALVRLAVFNESRRVPLRREEINKRVLGANTRAFTNVLLMAQEILRSVFGMELVELASRAEREREQNMNDEIQDDANATGLRKKTAASGSKSYILRSTLAAELIEVAARSDEQLIDLEYSAENDDEDAPQSYGSIISWSTIDQLGGLGLLYVILALILVNGHILSDPELKKHLKSFRLSLSSTIEFAPHATHKSATIEAYLSTLVKQGYLDKVKVGPAGAPRATQGKRARNADADEEGVSYEWRWGARAQAEVGELAIAQFVAEFMAERVLRDTGRGDGDDESTGPQRRDFDEEEGQRVLDSMMKGITRAAGGKLNDITGRY